MALRAWVTVVIAVTVTVAAADAKAAGLGDVEVKLRGVVDRGEAGFDAVTVGDLDADGHEELLVGAPFGDAGRGRDGGAAYLFYGPVDAAADLSAADVTFLGARPGDYAGEDVGAVGDLDGDGFDDLLLGAPGSVPGLQPGGPRPGEAYLFYGGSERRAGTVLLQPGCTGDGTCDAVFTGTHPSDFAGFGLPKHPIGDVDGDGHRDLLIGSAGFGAFGGAAHLFYGRVERFQGTVPLATAHASFVAAPGRIATTPMTGAGDLDGDGFADFAIGAASWFPSASIPGEVYVFYGGPDRRSGVAPMAAADAVLKGSVDGDRAGDGLAGGGDVDGDGLADLLVGVPGAEGTTAGAAHVVYGSEQRLAGSMSLAGLTGAATFLGAETGDQAGEGVALGDLDGDGFADAAIGAPQAGDGGIVYVVPGGPRRTGAHSLTGVAHQYLAETEGDRAGATIAIGRFAGAAPALAIAAPRHDNGRGAVYVISTTIRRSCAFDAGPGKGATDHRVVPRQPTAHPPRDPDRVR